MAKQPKTAVVSGPREETPAAEWVHVATPKRHPKNPRQHGPEVVRLARTIIRTRWGAPLLIQKRSGRLIGGHGRQDAGLLVLAGLEVDGEIRGGAAHMFDPGAPGPGYVPARVLDVDDATADAMMLADNAGALQGVDDPAALVALAAQFGRESALLADLGMDAAALDALVATAGNAVIENAPARNDDPPPDTGPQLGGLVYRLVVDCHDENHQGELMQRLEAEGLHARPLIS